MNIKELKTTLNSLVDRKVVLQHKENGQNLAVLLFKRFNITDMELLDKKEQCK